MKILKVESVFCLKPCPHKSGVSCSPQPHPTAPSSTGMLGLATRLPGVVSWHQLAIPGPWPPKWASNLSLLLPPFLWEEPKEELAKTVMGLVMRHSDIRPLLGVLGGEVTLTSQEHRTKKGLKGSLCPGTSVIRNTALSRKSQKCILHLFQ